MCHPSTGQIIIPLICCGPILTFELCTRSSSLLANNYLLYIHTKNRTVLQGQNQAPEPLPADQEGDVGLALSFLCMFVFICMTYFLLLWPFPSFIKMSGKWKKKCQYQQGSQKYHLIMVKVEILRCDIGPQLQSWWTYPSPLKEKELKQIACMKCWKTLLFCLKGKI